MLVILNQIFLPTLDSYFMAHNIHHVGLILLISIRRLLGRKKKIQGT